jgi:putative ABC transport system permease protein
MNLFTELREGLKISFAAIRANKLRAALTTLGIIIGVVTVTLMGTAIAGLNQSFMNSISALGTDVLYVSRQSWMITSHEEWMKMRKRRDITEDQFRAVQRQAHFARAIAPIVDGQQPVRFKNRRSDNAGIIGTTDDYAVVGGFNIVEGRFFSTAESDGGRPVCVIGSDVATNLFPREAAIGNRISIGPRSFEVVGVLEKQGGMIDTGTDRSVMIPLQQFTGWFYNRPDITLAVKVRDVTLLEDAREELRALMRRIRQVPPGDPDDFTINQQDQFVEMFHQIGGTIAAVGLFITGLSLFVGGIGIMNIMFVSVAERTREIGIRKAIGAKRRTILLQFLMEAAAICLLGGLMALAIAWPITLVMQKFMPATLSLFVVSIALLVSLLTGVISGFLPAWRAARMNPVDALRAE